MLKGKRVVLREKTVTDAAKDYAWRCDPDLCCLDAVPPLKMPYSEYVGYYTDELQNSSRRRRRFAIDSIDGKHIGNCMYYDIDWDRKQAELGIMIGDRGYWGQGFGTDAVNTLVHHMFNDTDVNRIYLKTLEWNIRAQRCFQRCGFVSCGKTTRHGNDFMIMELHRSWLKPAEDEKKVKPGHSRGKAYLPYAT